MQDENNGNENKSLRRSLWVLAIEMGALCIGCVMKGLGWIVGIWLGLQLVGGIDLPFNCNFYGF